MSIDCEDTQEIDDALSCRKLPNGNYLLGVHNVSVLSYFPYESDIVQEAIQRNQSIHLPHKFQGEDGTISRTIPIFPYEFSTDMGALREGKARLTRSYIFEITPSGEVVHEEFVKSITRNNKQLTYEEANQILVKGTDSHQLQKTLENLAAVATILEKKYKGTELYEKVKESREDVTGLVVKKKGSENIVYQAMLLTGNRVAEFFARNNLPLLYRVHEVDRDNKALQEAMDKINKAYGEKSLKNLISMFQDVYPRGWYAIEGRHEGLDIDHYCHCTSALRRAADIVVEHALEVCYDKKPSAEEIEELRKEIISKAVEINARHTPIEYFAKEYKKKYHRG